MINIPFSIGIFSDSETKASKSVFDTFFYSKPWAIYVDKLLATKWSLKMTVLLVSVRPFS